MTETQVDKGKMPFCDDNEASKTQELRKSFKLEVQFQITFLKFTAHRCNEYLNLKDVVMNAKALYKRKSRDEKWASYFADIGMYKMAVHMLYEYKLVNSEIREVHRIMSMSSQSHYLISNDLVIEFIQSVVENLKDLGCFKVDLDDTLKLKLKALRGKLRFLRNFLIVARCRCTEHEKLNDLFTHAKFVADKAAYLAQSCLVDEMDRGMVEKLVFNISVLVRMIDKGVPISEVREVHRIISRSSQFHDLMSNDRVIEFIKSLQKNLKALDRSKVNLDDPLKIKLKEVEGKLRSLRTFLTFMRKSSGTEHEKLNDLFTHAEFAANNVAYLTYSCFVEEDEEDMVNKLVFDLSDLARRIDPLTSPEVRQIYIRVLKACSEPSSQPEPLLQADLRGDKITVKFIESLLENVAEVFCVGGGIPMRDQFKVLQEELVFIKGILMDPPEYFDTMSLSCLFMHIKLASIKTGIVVYSLGVSEMNVEITGKVYSSPLDFLEESMKLFKVKYMEIYLKSPFPKSPSTDELGFLDYFLGNLAELLNNQTDPSTRLNLPTKPLVEEFQFLRSFLSKIAKQHTEQENLNVLWEQIINVAYKTEYIVDSLLVGNGLIWPRMPWLSEIRKRIEVLKTEVNKIGEDTMYNSEVYSSAEISYQASLSATSPEIDEVVIGLKTEEESLLKHLVGRSSKLKMISIVGMPGLGKTHFSKRIYNNQIVKDYFDVCAWCFVSQVHNKKNLLMVILSQVAGPIEDISLKTDEELAELLYKSLKGNRYLIVMDDMWDIEAWDALQRSFPDDNNGSIIMFTTRYQNLNLKVSSDNKIYLRRFSDDESWQLLQEKLFSGETCPSELIEVGKEMAKNCDGLPLAVVLVAGILAKIDMQEPQWRKVASSLSSLIVGDPEKKSMKVIELSYNHLPGYLKSCFLYIGAFCKNKYIQVRKLVRLWVAEGFVHKVEPKSFEDTSKDYLMDLIGRSLIIITERGSRWDVKVCHVHVLVLDFCLEKAKDEFFLKPIEQLRISTSDLSRKIIHEQRRIRSSRPERFLSSKMYCPNLRSLLFSDASNSFGKGNCDVISSIFGKFKLLKVLDLVCINVDGTFPDGINSLGHLRYLALRGSFVSIPPSIANLQNLQTLIVEAFPYQVLLPHTIWNMVKLRHLQISNCCFGSKQLRGHVSRLQNLQTLSNLELSYEEDTGELLEGLSNVKRLKCIFLHCNGLVELATLKKLESLTLTYQGKPWGPCEFSFPSSIKKLTLSVFRFPWNQISMIGKLPNLEVLKLLFEAFVGEEWEMEDGEFPKLRFLKLSGLDIRKWSVSSDHFPPLEQLVLESCRYLEEIPSSLAEIPTLKMIEAKWCNKSLDNVIKQIKEEQVDMGNQEFDGIIEHFVE